MVKVEINGKTFDLFKQVDVSISLDNFAREGQIIVTEPPDDTYSLKLNDEIKIYFDEILVLTGYLEDMSDSEDNSNHDITYNLRDKVCDLIDSSIPEKLYTVKGVKKLKELIERAISGLGLDIKVIDDRNVDLDNSDKAGEIGQLCGTFLMEYARANQSILNSDADGNVWIRKTGTDANKLKTYLIEEVNGKYNNILSSALSVSNKDRYHKYIVRSNQNTNTKAKDGKWSYSSVKGEITDDEVRKSRIFEKISEKPMTADQCKEAAKEEANLRRIRGFNYSCSVVGFSANNELWFPGFITKLVDQKKGLSGDFLIKDVQFTYSGEGEMTSMTLTYPDAYKVKVEPPKPEQVKVKQVKKDAKTILTETKQTTNQKKNKGFYEKLVK